MKVKELIEKLSKYDKDLDVLVYDDYFDEYYPISNIETSNDNNKDIVDDCIIINTK